MIEDIKEATPSLQRLHEHAVLGLERRGVKLPRRNVLSYDLSSTDPYMDDICLVLLDVLAAQTSVRTSFGAELPARIRSAIVALDKLLSASEPLPRCMHDAANEIVPDVQKTFEVLALTRIQLLEVLEMLAWIVPAPATAKVSDEDLPTLFAYQLKVAKVPLEYIADLVGEFDGINPEVTGTERLDAQDRKLGNLQRRLDRFERGNSSTTCTSPEQQDSVTSGLPSAVRRDLQDSIARYEHRCMITRLDVPAAPRCEITDDYLGEIRDQLARLLSDHEEQLNVTCWLTRAQDAMRQIDQLLPHLQQVLNFVEQCARAKFKNGSRFEPPLLERIQGRAHRIDAIVSRLAQSRVGLVGFVRLLGSVQLPSDVTIVGEDRLKSAFAYRLELAGVPPRVIADAIGQLEGMDPHLHESDRVLETETRVRAVRRRIRRFGKTLRTGCTTTNRVNVSLSN